MLIASAIFSLGLRYAATHPRFVAARAVVTMSVGFPFSGRRLA